MAIIPPALRKKIFGKGKAPAESESASDEGASSESESEAMSGEEGSASDMEEGKAPAKGGKTNPLKKWAAARAAAGAKG